MSMEYCPTKGLVSSKTPAAVRAPTLLRLLDSTQQRTPAVAGQEVEEGERAPHNRCAHGGCCSQAR